MAKCKSYSLDFRSRIIQFYKRGILQKGISITVNIPKNTVSCVNKQFKVLGHVIPGKTLSTVIVSTIIKDLAKSTDRWTFRNIIESYQKKAVRSDESKYNLISSDGIVHVRRLKGQKLNKKYIKPTVKHGGGNILHSVKLMKEWLEQKQVCGMKWAAQSPDLKPIENLWHLVDCMTGKLIRSGNKLFEKFTQVWHQVNRQLIKELVESMARRIAEWVKAIVFVTPMYIDTYLGDSIWVPDNHTHQAISKGSLWLGNMLLVKKSFLNWTIAAVCNSTGLQYSNKSDLYGYSPDGRDL
ncbi:uncharacterized protein [Euwallacea similis]|uniref:uncharacterized protein n=1 Tax=Euwallacea similis TaxID=1736056 RepID=UPI00344F927E